MIYKHSREEDSYNDKEDKPQVKVSIKTPEDEVIESFRQENSKDGTRVFVAGGSRSGNDEQYTAEAYELGQTISKMDFKLDFGLSNRGIMGAVACGVLYGWNKQGDKKDIPPIQGITTRNYFKRYPNDADLIDKMEIVVARTLEARKKKLLKADYVVFAPGGVGTLDELAYDCVAMQDGMLPIKPFIIYNINGFFHHLLEFLKHIAHEGFAEPIPFIVVDNADELEMAFRWLKIKKFDHNNGKEVFVMSRKLIYEMPYYRKQKEYYDMTVEECAERMDFIKLNGTDFDRRTLIDEIRTAYFENEIEKMYNRLAHTARDTGIASEKLVAMKKRLKEIKG